MHLQHKTLHAVLNHASAYVTPSASGHHAVAAFHLKGFEIPLEYTGIWRYLNNAYNEDIFLRTCPPDQEIVLHWASRPDTPSLSYEEFSSLTRYTAKFSFDVPALAIPIVLN